jgi:hypothetical protein
MCALLVTTTFGCEQVKKQAATVGATVKDKVELIRERFFHKKPPVARSTAPVPAAPSAGATPASPGAPGAPPVDVSRTPARPVPAQPVPAEAAPAEPIPQIPAIASTRMRDVPFVSQDTGTIFPGMAERDVYSLWGAPAAVRHRGEFTYLFFQNGCEYSCGMMDVVTLKNGQVFDAVVRWPGHGYGGQSTSPTSETPDAPPGGDKLIISPDTMRTPDTLQSQPTP